jgi:hypothetical protein
MDDSERGQFKPTLGLRMRVSSGQGFPDVSDAELASAKVDAVPAATPPLPAPEITPPGPATSSQRGYQRMVSKLGELFYWKKDY